MAERVKKCRCIVHTGVEKWHGLTSGYQYHACNCDACRGRWAQYNAEYQKYGKYRQVLVRVCQASGCVAEFEAISNQRYCSDVCRENAKASRIDVKATWTPEERRAYRERTDPLIKRRRKYWEAQNGICALCHLPVAWEKSCLDHDHKCCDTRLKDACGNCDRAVLHNHCNAILGFSRDDIKLLRQAIDYLEVA